MFKRQSLTTHCVRDSKERESLIWRDNFCREPKTYRNNLNTNLQRIQTNAVVPNTKWWEKNWFQFLPTCLRCRTSFNAQIIVDWTFTYFTNGCLGSLIHLFLRCPKGMLSKFCFLRFDFFKKSLINFGLVHFLLTQSAGIQ